MSESSILTTYAQYNEDIVLLALLHDVKNGFYVDVGANYPVVDSVTKLFYDRGWQGINIEPIPTLYAQLKKLRTRDINLQCGVGDSPSTKVFHEIVHVPGQSSFGSKVDKTQEYKEYEVTIRTLASILEEHKVSHIDFLKIDVEGFEYEVVKGNDWTKYRPEVICIEANHINHDWRPILTKNRYKLFIADGLNEYYVAQESWYRTEGFDERVIKLDYHALKQHQQATMLDYKEQVKLLTDANQDLKLRLQDLSQQNAQLKGLSLSGRSLPGRVRVALYGLTIDWLKRTKAK